MNRDEIRNQVMDIESSPLGEAEEDAQTWSGIEPDGTKFIVSRHAAPLPTRWMQMIALSLEGSSEGMSMIVNDFCGTYGAPSIDESYEASRYLEWTIEDPVFVSPLPEPEPAVEARTNRLLRILRR